MKHLSIKDHDNATSHKSGQTSDFFSTYNVDLMDRTSYSPDLSSNDLFYSRISTTNDKSRVSGHLKMLLLEVPNQNERNASNASKTVSIIMKNQNHD